MKTLDAIREATDRALDRIFVICLVSLIVGQMAIVLMYHWIGNQPELLWILLPFALLLALAAALSDMKFKREIERLKGKI